MKYIVIKGNPIEGFQYTGPFNTGKEAAEYGEDLQVGGDWWIAELYSPED